MAEVSVPKGGKLVALIALYLNHKSGLLQKLLFPE